MSRSRRQPVPGAPLADTDRASNSRCQRFRSRPAFGLAAVFDFTAAFFLTADLDFTAAFFLAADLDLAAALDLLAVFAVAPVSASAACAAASRATGTRKGEQDT